MKHSKKHTAPEYEIKTVLILSFKKVKQLNDKDKKKFQKRLYILKSTFGPICVVNVVEGGRGEFFRGLIAVYRQKGRPEQKKLVKYMTIM